MLRYGLGAGYDLLTWCDGYSDHRLSGVVEFVGWSILGGQALFSEDGIPENAIPIDVTGDTIVNGKFGVRYTTRDWTLSASYGRALTREVWYDDIVRAEWRFTF